MDNEYIPNENQSIWVVFDLNNGRKETHRYCWWFSSREQAMEYIQWQKKQKHPAELSSPVEYTQAPRSPMDDLCRRMLQVGAFAEGTQDMTASDIKALLLPFFGQDTIDRATYFLCGRGASRPDFPLNTLLADTEL